MYNHGHVYSCTDSLMSYINGSYTVTFDTTQTLPRQMLYIRDSYTVRSITKT